MISKVLHVFPKSFFRGLVGSCRAFLQLGSAFLSCSPDSVAAFGKTVGTVKSFSLQEAPKQVVVFGSQMMFFILAKHDLS